MISITTKVASSVITNGITELNKRAKTVPPTIKNANANIVPRIVLTSKDEASFLIVFGVVFFLMMLMPYIRLMAQIGIAMIADGIIL